MPPTRRSLGRARSARLAALALALAACAKETAPWEGVEGRRDDWRARRLAIAPPPAPSASASAAPDVPVPATQPNRGDACDAGFRPSGEPRVDLARLAAICGPPERFRREGDTYEGVVAEGGAVVEVPLRLVAHRCYRIFAVAEATTTDLDVELRSERDVVLASDDDHAPVVALHRRGAICTEADAAARIVFRASAGRGRFAAEAWSRSGDDVALPVAPIDGRGAED